MKGFLALFLCVCFVGLPGTSQASEQEYREACEAGNLDACHGKLRWDYFLRALLEDQISYEESHEGLYGCSLLEYKESVITSLSGAACGAGSVDHCILVEDYVKTLSSFKRSCDEESLAIRNSFRIGLVNNFSRAKDFAISSCIKGNLDECNNLGILEYTMGNVEVATNFFIGACDGGSTDGCANLIESLPEQSNSADEKLQNDFYKRYAEQRMQ